MLELGELAGEGWFGQERVCQISESSRLGWCSSGGPAENGGEKNAPFCMGGWGRLHVKMRKGLKLAGSNMPEGRRGSGIECKKQGWKKNEAK